MTTVYESVGLEQANIDEAIELTVSDTFPLPLDSSADPYTTYRDLWERYSTSEEGLHQAAQRLRFSVRYGYDRAAMLKDLGRDVHPLEHMHDVHDLFQELLLSQLRDRKTLGSLALADIALCRFTAQVHDVGENTHASFPDAVDDIPYGDKQPWQRRAEQDIRRSIFTKFWGDLPGSFLERADILVMHTPETEKDVVAHDHVEAAHQLGSYLSGIAGGTAALHELIRLDQLGLEVSQLSIVEMHRLDCLKRLGLDVTRSMHPIMEDLGNQFVYAAALLEKHEDVYQRIGRELVSPA